MHGVDEGIICAHGGVFESRRLTQGLWDAKLELLSATPVWSSRALSMIRFDNDAFYTTQADLVPVASALTRTFRGTKLQAVTNPRGYDHYHDDATDITVNVRRKEPGHRYYEVRFVHPSNLSDPHTVYVPKSITRGLTFVPDYLGKPGYKSSHVEIAYNPETAHWDIACANYDDSVLFAEAQPLAILKSYLETML